MREPWNKAITIVEQKAVEAWERKNGIVFQDDRGMAV